MEDNLRSDCKVQSTGRFVWEMDATEGYMLANSLFQNLASMDIVETELTLWFPKFHKKEVLDEMARILNANSPRMGGLTATTSAWPSSPASRIQLSFPRGGRKLELVTSASAEGAVEATSDWVDNTLGRLGLCPHTASMEKAAIGLEGVSVKQGPVVIRESTAMFPDTLDSISLLASFWNCVSEMATRPEQDLATILLLAPPAYDNRFLEFAGVCDELLEPTVQATKAESVVGRAWFHPAYDAEAVGHKQILPGHALPGRLVEKFMRQQQQQQQQQRQQDTTRVVVPDAESIARANNAVRWSPHATVNLLRRSQLNAAKQVEAMNPNKKPNSIYARNVLRILADDDTGGNRVQ